MTGALDVFNLRGHLSRWRYILAFPIAFFAQHLLVAAMLWGHGLAPHYGVVFWLAPVRSLAQLQDASTIVLLASFVGTLVMAWLLTALSFKRSSAAEREGWIAGLAFVPLVQVAVFAYLASQPDREPRPNSPEVEEDNKSPIDSALGLLTGMALTVAAVAVGALVFGSYGYTMFVLSPFFIGATTAYVVNRRGDIGGGATIAHVAAALAFGGAGLLVTALEGVVCLLMSSPLIGAVGLLGGALGRAVAGMTRQSGRPAIALTALPLMFLAEAALPPAANFQSEQAIEIAAPPTAVWNALIRMDRIESKPAPPFQLGVAYPTGASLTGEGVGASRRGEFSTGAAVERITAWEPDRKLAFEVLSNPPAMRELSPYEHVHAPHVVGYFDTEWTSFEIEPAEGGASRLLLRSAHQLKLDPVLYWLPMARWVVALDNRRVLEHVRAQAEAA